MLRKSKVLNGWVRFLSQRLNCTGIPLFILSSCVLDNPPNEAFKAVKSWTLFSLCDMRFKNGKEEDVLQNPLKWSLKILKSRFTHFTLVICCFSIINEDPVGPLLGFNSLAPTSNLSNEQNWRFTVLNWRLASEKVKTPFGSKGGLFHIWWWMLSSQYLLLQLRYVWTGENMRAHKTSFFAELFS